MKTNYLFQRTQAIHYYSRKDENGYYIIPPQAIQEGLPYCIVYQTRYNVYSVVQTYYRFIEENRTIETEVFRSSSLMACIEYWNREISETIVPSIVRFN